jgi:hypothetical protein
MEMIAYIVDMKKRLFLLATGVFLFTGVCFSQTGKDGARTKGKEATKDSTVAVKKPMPKSCPGKTCGKKKS